MHCGGVSHLCQPPFFPNPYHRTILSQLNRSVHNAWTFHSDYAEKTMTPLS